MTIVETPWTISSWLSSGAAAWPLALRSSGVNLGFLASRMMEVATSLAGDDGWREDVDRGLVDHVSSSEATRSLRARWSGQHCERLSEEGAEDEE